MKTITSILLIGVALVYLLTFLIQIPVSESNYKSNTIIYTTDPLYSNWGYLISTQLEIPHTTLIERTSRYDTIIVMGDLLIEQADKLSSQHKIIYYGDKREVFILNGSTTNRNFFS